MSVLFKIILSALIFLSPVIVYSQEIPIIGFATWYSRASCLREGTSGIMANGKRLDDEKLTAASWYYRFGTRVKVTSATGRSVIVTITDRGPSKRLVKRGKIIDLSRAAFRTLGGLGKGVIPVTVEVI
jgi:rare lipoprotein A